MGNTRSTSLRIVSPGALGPAPVVLHDAGTWPEGVDRTVANRWAVARAGTVHGYFGEPVWYERCPETDALTPILAYGIWPVGPACPGSMADCMELGCPSSGRCCLPRT